VQCRFTVLEKRDIVELQKAFHLFFSSVHTTYCLDHTCFKGNVWILFVTSPRVLSNIFVQLLEEKIYADWQGEERRYYFLQFKIIYCRAE
jgi:hypothetical protein